MKEELERIWARPKVAFPMHIAGWLTKEMAIERRLGYYETGGLMPYRGKKVPLKIIRKKRK